MKAKLKHTLEGAGESLYCLCASDQKGIFYSGGKSNYILRWNLQNIQETKAICSLPFKAFSLEFIDEYNYLLIGQSSGGIHIVDLNSNKEIRLLQAHEGIIYNLKYISSKKILIATSGDGHFSIWSVPSFKLLAKDFVSAGNLRSMTYIEEGGKIIFGAGDGNLYTFDLEFMSAGLKIAAHKTGFSITALEYIPEKKLLLSASRDAHVMSYDTVHYFEIIDDIPAHNYAIYSLKYNAHLEIYASASMDKTIKLWNLKEKAPLARLDLKSNGHKSSVNDLLWISKTELVSCSDDKTIKIWSVE